MATQAPTVKVYYGKPMLPDVSRVLACLHEKDVEFNLIDMYEGQQMNADLVKLQASRTPVSAFEDGNTRLFESRAICRHIVEKYAERGNKYLLGRDLLERASIEQWLKSEQHSFNPPSWALVCHLAFNVEADQALITESERRLSKVLDVYEQRLAVSKFLAGDEFSLADLYHLPNSHYIVGSRKWGYLFESRKNVSKWWEEISSRYSWQEVVKILNEVGLLEEVEVRSNGGYKFLVQKKLQLHSPSEEQKDLTDQEHPTHIPVSTGKSIVLKSTTTPQSSLPLVFDPSREKISKIIQPMNMVDSVKQSVTPQGEKEQQIHQADTANKFAYEPTTTKEAPAGAPSSQTKHEEKIAPDDQSTADSKPLPQEKKEPTDTKPFSRQDTSSESSSDKKEESAKTTGADYGGQPADQQDTGEDNSSKSPKSTDARGTPSEKLGEKKEENTQTSGSDTKGRSADQQDTEKVKSSKAPESTDTKFSSQQDTTGESYSSKSPKPTDAQGTPSEKLGEKKEENTQTTGADTKGRSADQQDTEKGKSSKAPESTDTKFSSQQDTTGESFGEKKDESAKTTEAEYKVRSADQQDTGEDNSSKSSKSTGAQGTPSEKFGEKKEENTPKTGADAKGRSDDQQDTEKVKPSKAPESTDTKFSSQQHTTSESDTKVSSQQGTTSESSRVKREVSAKTIGADYRGQSADQQDTGEDNSSKSPKSTDAQGTPTEKSSEKMEENAQTTGADTTGQSADHGEVNSSNAPKSMESTSAKETDPSTESKK
ncbi:uncharacterized protein A4U43_C07F23980 [Asparagus officinalis]|uniref:glutathione transferase n=1 Tax=Asparagus officinalis TaxID=4686 RepID=A0A5P1EEF6_ASPOF|nr:uncharacterized protein LOC109848860 [Asparagus officinalis]ONK64276.1 uncharacterized protein A4U43_C07F23980 [Asparagus officinalis]